MARRVDPVNADEAKDRRQNRVAGLLAHGQSVWLDSITRTLVRGGELKRLIEEGGLRGMTSNPTIFEKALSSGGAYDEQIRELVGQGKDVPAIVEALAVEDIRGACDLFRPLYDRTSGLDGFVSIEVSPHVARDTAGTLSQARRLWGWWIARTRW